MSTLLIMLNNSNTRYFLQISIKCNYYYSNFAFTFNVFDNLLRKLKNSNKFNFLHPKRNPKMDKRNIRMKHPEKAGRKIDQGAKGKLTRENENWKK